MAKTGEINPETDLGQAALEIAKYNAFRRTIPQGDMEDANFFNKLFAQFYKLRRFLVYLNTLLHGCVWVGTLSNFD